MRQLHRVPTELGKRYRNLVREVAGQMGRNNPTDSGAQMLRRAGTRARFCERDEEARANGNPVDEENYRRNTAALKSVLIALGLAKKSRDVTKADSRFIDQHTAALIDVE